MSDALKKRIDVVVPRTHLASIKSSLVNFDPEDLTVRPLIAGWTTAGYWSSEQTFSRIGEQVLVSFTIDPDTIAPLLEIGFGIFTTEIVKLSVRETVIAA